MVHSIKIHRYEIPKTHWSSWLHCNWTIHRFTSRLYTKTVAVVSNCLISRGILLNKIGPQFNILFLNNVVLNCGQIKFMLLLLVLHRLSTNLNIEFWFLYIKSNAKYLCIYGNLRILFAEYILVVDSYLFIKYMHLIILFCATVNLVKNDGHVQAHTDTQYVRWG